MVFDKLRSGNNTAATDASGQPGYGTTGAPGHHHHGPNHPAAEGAGIGAGVGAAEHLRENHQGQRAYGQNAGVAGNHPTMEGAAAGGGLGAGYGAYERHQDRKAARGNPAANDPSLGGAGYPSANAGLTGAGAGAGMGAGTGAGAGVGTGASGPGGVPGTGQKIMGRLEQAAGTVLNNDTMKARGIAKETQGHARDNLGANQHLGRNQGAGGVSGY